MKGEYTLKAKEPENNIIHIWEGLTFFKARDVSLDLAKQGWREISINIRGNE